MVTNRGCPKIEVLENVLDPMADLPIEVDDHIGSCHSCQTRLETLAANQDWWQDTERILVSHSAEQSLAAGRIAQAVCPLAGNDSEADGLQSRAIHADVELERLQATLAPASHPELLGRIGRYELEQLVGHGGMGLVFRARDLELHRVVAVKTLSAAFMAQPTARQRFLREARASASLVHPHIVAVHDIVPESPVPAIVMQFVAGPTLQQFLQDNGALPWREVLRLGVQLCDALEQAHSNGLIHRDIKPGNVLLEGGCQRAMLTDFGLVRALDAQTMTHTGAITGTPEFMSPEQAWGSDLDCRSDLFSLGALLYTMLTGDAPFRAEAPMATLNLVCNSPHLPLHRKVVETPKEVCRLVDKLLQKQPRRRHSSASEVRKNMLQLLQSDIVLRPRNTTKKMITAAGLTLASAATIGGLLYMKDRPETSPAKLPGEVSSGMHDSAYTDYQRPSESESGFAIIEATDTRIEQVRRMVREVEASMTARASQSTTKSADPIQSAFIEMNQQLQRLEEEEVPR